MKPRQLLECNQPLTGKRVRLVRMNPSHLDFLFSCFANKPFWSAYRANQKLTGGREELTRELDRDLGLLPAQRGKIEWVVERLGVGAREEPEPVGFAALSAFDTAQSQAEFMVGIIAAEQRQAGIPLEASLLVLDYAFNKERLQKLLSFVYANNPSAQKSTLALGFSNETLLKRHLRLDDTSEYLDVYRNSLSEKQFRANQRLARLSQRLLGVDVTRNPRKANPTEFDLQASFELNR